jgi:hypothetical protein
VKVRSALAGIGIIGALCGWTILSISLAAAGVGRLGVPHTAGQWLEPVFFGILAVLPLAVTVRHYWGGGGRVTREVALVGLWFGSFAALAIRIPVADALRMGWVLVAASAEEVVFRVALPATFARQLLRAGVRRKGASFAALLLSQLLFAACHFLPEPGTSASFSTIHFGRFLVAGCLYGALVALFGVGFASAVHAGLNIEIITAPAPLPLRLEPWQLGAAGLMSAGALWATLERHPWYRNSHPELEYDNDDSTEQDQPRGHGGGARRGGSDRVQLRAG